MEYDVVIGGASFAGLALAQTVLRAVPARVVVVDRYALGTHQTSACALPLDLVRSMEAGGSVLQIHRSVWFHTPGGSARLELPKPYCTVSYRHFCRGVAAASGVEFQRSRILGVRGNSLILPGRTLSGRVLVDATGWKAVMASSLRAAYVEQGRRWLAAGLEAELPIPWEEGLHLYFDRHLVPGYAWAFGCGATTRVGVGSYDRRAPLKQIFQAFVERMGLPMPDRFHGGVLAYGLRDPIVGNLFVVGDAAGQCLPATGEGIRPAIEAAQVCGYLLAKVLRGYPLPAAAQLYRAYVDALRRRHRALTLLQAAVSRAPAGVLVIAARLLERPVLRGWFLRHYLGDVPRNDLHSPRPERSEDRVVHLPRG